MAELVLIAQWALVIGFATLLIGRPILREYLKHQVLSSDTSDPAPKALRALSNQERTWLERQIEIQKRIFKLCLTAFAFGTAMFLLHRYLLQIGMFQTAIAVVAIVASLWLLSFVAGVLLCILLFDSLAYHDKRPVYFRYKKDLESKVCQIQGKIFIADISTGKFSSYVLSVHKQEFYFNAIQLSRMKELRGIHSSDLVSIEYSPSSMHIWNITKLDSGYQAPTVI